MFCDRTPKELAAIRAKYATEGNVLEAPKLEEALFSARRCAMAEASHKEGGSIIFTTQIGLLFLIVIIALNL